MGATIAAAAYAQIGVGQDCTALATNALAAAGINYHGWPAGYLSLGRTVSAAEAQPGDLATTRTAARAWPTSLFTSATAWPFTAAGTAEPRPSYSVNVGSGPVFIRVGG